MLLGLGAGKRCSLLDHCQAILSPGASFALVLLSEYHVPGKLSSTGSSSVQERWAGLTARSFAGVLNFHLPSPCKINK